MTTTATRTAPPAGYADSLLSGRVFTLAANGVGSAIGYRPMVRSDRWAHVMVTLGTLAGRSPVYAQMVSGIIRDLPLYQTEHEMLAKMYRNAAAVVAAGYDDVERAASPEPGRASDRVRPYNLREVTTLALALNAARQDQPAGVGWALAAVADDLGIAR